MTFCIMGKSTGVVKGGRVTNYVRIDGDGLANENWYLLECLTALPFTSNTFLIYTRF